MIGAGLLARNARARGLTTQALGEDLALAGLASGLRLPGRQRPAAAARGARLSPDRLRLHDLHGQFRPLGRPGGGSNRRQRAHRRGRAVRQRNFEGRIHPAVRANFLASPPLVVAYALAGTILKDLASRNRSAKIATAGRFTCATSGPTAPRSARSSTKTLTPGSCSAAATRRSAEGTARSGARHRGPQATLFAWNRASTFIRRPPFFDDMGAEPTPSCEDIRGARVLAMFGDMFTTDHISPIGAISKGTPAGRVSCDRSASRRAISSITPRGA